MVDRAPRLDAAAVPIQDNYGNPVIDETPIYTFHALRHAVASLFIEQGWSPKKL
jgi:integrase